MSSIRWSALFLSLATPLACAPHYDVGDAGQDAGAGGDGAGGSSTTGGTDDTGGTGGSGTGTGGTGTTGGSGGTNGSGGASVTGGSGGSGEVGGSEAGGSDTSGGTGGSSVAGSAGSGMAGGPSSPACGRELAPEYPPSLAAPEDVWERISRFLFDEVREPPSELPEDTSPQWAVQILRQALDQSRATSASGQAALIPFMQKFLDAEPAGAAGDPPYERWARQVGAEGARLGILFEGDEASNPPFGLFGTIAGRYDGLSERGAFLVSRFFCVDVPGSPVEFPPIVAPPNQTRREALAANLQDPNCVGCHAAMDPLAYPLEVLTPETLEYRTTENGVPIDTSGTYSGAWDSFQYADLASLGEQLSDSCEVARCLTLQLWNEAMPDSGLTSTSPQIESALYAFATPESPDEERFRFQGLLEAIVRSPAFLE